MSNPKIMEIVGTVLFGLMLFGFMWWSMQGDDNDSGGKSA